MSAGSWLDRRLDLSRWTLLLLLGDVVALTAFVAAGQGHHTGVSPLAMPVRLLWVVAPFFLGWFLAALVGGLYSHDVLAGPRRTFLRAAPAWIIGAIVGLALRSTSLFPGTVTGLFPVVVLFVGAVVMVGWRTVAAALLAWRRA